MGIKYSHHIRTCDVCGAESEELELIGWIMLVEFTASPSSHPKASKHIDMCPNCVEQYGLGEVMRRLPDGREV